MEKTEELVCVFCGAPAKPFGPYHGDDLLCERCILKMSFPDIAEIHDSRYRSVLEPLILLALGWVSGVICMLVVWAVL